MSDTVVEMGKLTVEVNDNLKINEFVKSKCKIWPVSRDDVGYQTFTVLPSGTHSHPSAKLYAEEDRKQRIRCKELQSKLKQLKGKNTEYAQRTCDWLRGNPFAEKQ